MGLPLIRSTLVVGTTTGAGQTLIATALVKALCDQGVRAVGMQVLARGVPAAGGLRPGDELQRLAEAGALGLPARALVPKLLPPGRDAGAPAVDDVVERFRMLATWADAVILEAGDGPRDSLLPDCDPLGLARRLDLPVVLVVALSDGCVDAALDQLARLQRAGVECVAWIANDAAAHPQSAEWLAALRHRIPARELGTVPRLGEASVAGAAEALDLPRVLHALAA